MHVASDLAMVEEYFPAWQFRHVALEDAGVVVEYVPGQQLRQNVALATVE